MHSSKINFMIKQFSYLVFITLISTATTFGQCSLPSAKLIQASGCLGTNTLSLGAGPDYAVPPMLEPQQACALQEYIDNFAFNSITNNGSGCNNNEANYAFNKTLNTVVTPGSSYGFSIQSPGIINPTGYAIWIDYNQNGSFDDAGELAFTIPPTNGTVSGTITIPPTASLGVTHMRVRLGGFQWFVDGDGSTTTDMGETEDYLITIGSNTAVTYSWTSLPAGFTSAVAFPAIIPAINTTYILTVTDSALGCSNTTSVTVDSNHIYPVAYGDNVWNAYAFNGHDFNTYEGFYVDSELSFNSTYRWNSNGSPSDATGYTGCTVNADYHSVEFKRKGFPCGLYSIDIPWHADEASLYINDTLVFQDLTCCEANLNAWTGFLDANSRIEFSWQAVTGASIGSLELNKISGTPVATPISGAAKRAIAVV